MGFEKIALFLGMRLPQGSLSFPRRYHRKSSYDFYQNQAQQTRKGENSLLLGALETKLFYSRIGIITNFDVSSSGSDIKQLELLSTTDKTTLSEPTTLRASTR